MADKALSPLRRKDIETGRKLERDEIVTWLHEQWVTDATYNIDVFDMIDGIKAGDHLK